MKIAIVDDAKEQRNALIPIVKQYFEDRKERFIISPEWKEYDSGEDFLLQFKPKYFELVFLDIYMKEMNGINVAKRVAALDKNCGIIFFTTSDEHQLEGYGVHAAGYIMKPVSDHIPFLYTAMDYIMDKLQPDISGITVQTDFGELHLYYHNILYLDCTGRKLHLHLTNYDINIMGKYEDYQQQFLSDSRFIECYRNIIVNMDYIEAPLDCDFVLRNGERLPISRRKKAEVMGIYTKHFIYSSGKG